MFELAANVWISLFTRFFQLFLNSSYIYYSTYVNIAIQSMKLVELSECKCILFFKPFAQNLFQRIVYCCYLVDTDNITKEQSPLVVLNLWAMEH